MGTPENPDWCPRKKTPLRCLLKWISRKNKREFTALIRTEIFHFLRALASGKYEAAASIVPPWSAAELEPIMQDYYQEHGSITLDNEARNLRHTYITANDAEGIWTVAQVFIDPEGLNDWQAIFSVDKDIAREEGKPKLQLIGVGPIAGE